VPAAGAIILAAEALASEPGFDAAWAVATGRPLLAWAVEACVRTPDVSSVALVVRRDRLDAARELIARSGWHGVQAVISGGPRRRAAVRAGLAALPADLEWVIIHDGMRPLVTPEMIAAGLAAAARTGAAAAWAPVKETLKQVEGGVVTATVPRAKLALVQTPQVFRRALLVAAHAAAPANLDPPDDATLAQRAGIPVALFPAGADNLNVSDALDLAVVAALLAARIPPARAD
jgi:2-C-methyl-D-erythritol 4-phosphate cytidylyltransferase